MLCRKASDSWVCAANAHTIELFGQSHINKTFSDSPNKTKEAAQTMGSLF